MGNLVFFPWVTTRETAAILLLCIEDWIPQASLLMCRNILFYLPSNCITSSSVCFSFQLPFFVCFRGLNEITEFENSLTFPFISALCPRTYALPMSSVYWVGYVFPITSEPVCLHLKTILIVMGSEKELTNQRISSPKPLSKPFQN